MMGWIYGGSRVVGQTRGDSRLGVQEKAGISLYDEPTTCGNIYLEGYLVEYLVG
jgi:hypothetical protein